MVKEKITGDTLSTSSVQELQKSGFSLGTAKKLIALVSQPTLSPGIQSPCSSTSWRNLLGIMVAISPKVLSEVARLVISKLFSQSYKPITASFRQYSCRMTMNETASSDMWSWMTTQIRYTCKDIPDIKNADGFHNLFTFANGAHFGNKSVVLLIDEFQMIETCVHRKDFLITLKAIMDDITMTHNLWSVIGFGTSQLVTLAQSDEFKKKFKDTFSPFPLNNVIYIEPLPRHEVSLLLQRWASDRSVKIEAKTVEEIYNTTGGYAGLLGIIGIILDNSFPTIIAKHSGLIDSKVWLWLRTMATNLFLEQDQFKRLTELVLSDKSLSRLIPIIVGSGEPFIFKGEDYVSALTLCAFGVLWPEEKHTFNLCSPLMRQLLLSELYRPIDQFTLPKDWPEDIQSLLEAVFQRFDFSLFLVNESLNFTTNYPSEYNFQAEFFAVLQRGLQLYNFTNKTFYVASTEPKAPGMGRSRGDILVQNGKRILFELKSHQTWKDYKDLESAMLQVLEYSYYLDSKQIVILNLVPVATQISNIKIDFTNLQGRSLTVFEAVWNGGKVVLNTPKRTTHSSLITALQLELAIQKASNEDAKQS
ncbi:hypothetical protein SAMD00019534_115380 [Acytostelium subglobosum LB1]|uniref:hypothetical protein n=1 Tax=Acytostelium subglobosum LB1 TaxID=1410327 RepID=UPI00064511B2|nr:hypothetical protein SAMD00019534_115380 [Acytostelium subglobosum LB1]GAM28362.1 hypothetical protein SAMD00019534_115380 [Acytostelium subglobosum LB1]|eukprot:XP_012748679.1 hypothetical protein SAMD00019534_115380 [Acytostelium subglobosum LB1]